MRTIALILILTFCTSAIAEVKAVIDGQEKANPGDLFVLSAINSVGDGVKWITPEGVNVLKCSERELATAIGTPGVYEFTLIVADSEANIDYVRHSVTIEGRKPAPAPDDPGGPDEPGKPTPGVFGELLRLSKDQASRLGDPATARGIAEAIRATEAGLEKDCASGMCPGLAETKRRMVNAIERRLALRQGASLRADWLGMWRRPINDWIMGKNLADVPKYRAAMRATAMGLEESVE